MENEERDNINVLEEALETKTAEDIVAFIVDKFGGKVTLASSLGAEDQVLTHMLVNYAKTMDIFVLDTGRLHQETYDVMAKTREKYGVTYRLFFPDSGSVESMVLEKGPNLFYESVENRKECCFVRKVAPLKRALTGYSAWFTGIRRAQSVTRMQTPVVEWDTGHNMVKVNPLVTWSKRDVCDYIKAHDIPYNALHDLGFASIGCAPCTRAVEPGDDERAGRWWWETPEQKECGLHVSDAHMNTQVDENGDKK